MNSPLSPLLSAVGRSWWILLLYGLVALGFGVIAIGWPLSAAMALAWTLGVMAIVEGVISLFALISGGSGASRGWLALYVIASLGFGILAVINPLATASVLVLFLAAWLLVAGIYRIVFAIRVRKQIQGEWLLILSGVLAVVLGLLFAANPYAGVAVTTLWIGIGSLLYGLLQVLVAFKLRKLEVRTALAPLLATVLAAAGCTPGALPAEPGGKGHAPRLGVEVRLSAVDASGKGTPAQWRGETLMLREPPIAGSADIADVRYVLDEGQQPGLQIRYRPEARQRIHDGTAALVGKRAAISVDGRVLMVATVQGPFGESMMLSGLPSVAEAQALARHITGE
ncbi:DUF308 domain-containing protein [Stenotrophomonas maltophilia]